ncbi:CAP domain-containing protein [Streptomyces sp. NPDC003077]|uniref:CAP domain-containing protein n=1 Tax=Streptomyces sp. NPDC003077 TaxID=3154443 RepID=UPI0033B4E0DE
MRRAATERAVTGTQDGTQAGTQTKAQDNAQVTAGVGARAGTHAGAQRGALEHGEPVREQRVAPERAGAAGARALPRWAAREGDGPERAGGGKPSWRRRGRRAAARRGEDAEAAPGHRDSADARRTAPVRTGLLGASAAVAVGVVAVTSGLLPGGGRYQVHNGGEERRPADTRPHEFPLRTPSATATPRPGHPSGHEGPGGSRPSPAAPGTAPTPPRSVPPTLPASPPRAPGGAPTPAGTTARAGSATAVSSGTGPAPGTASTAESAILSPVDRERGRTGCAPLTADGRPTGLARDFGADMARRGFFGPYEPEGRTLWGRALDAGIAALGGEKTAHGQTEARAVLDTWTRGPGHRADILGCD